MVNPVSSKKRLLLLLPLIIVPALFWLATSLFSHNVYTVYADGEVVAVSGNFERVGDVLVAAGVDVRPEDHVVPSLAAVASPGEAIQVQRARAVTLRTDSGSRIHWTRQAHLGAFLREAGVQIQRTDQVYADGRQVPFNGLDRTELPAVVEIGRFVTVTVYHGEQQLVQRTAAQTVGNLLAELGITVYAADGVEPPLGSWIEPNMRIFVRPSLPFRIAVDGRAIETRSHHTGVLDILAEAGIGLVGQDYTRPAAEAMLRPGDLIEVIRVTEDFRLEDQPIPFQTLWQGTDELELDQRARLSAGLPGIMRQRVRVRYENGIEVGQTIDGEWVAQEPINEVIGYGTRIVVRTLETPQGVLEYWRMVRMRVTSYTASSSGKPPDHPAYGITASGLRAGTGIVAIDRNVVPFRSWVYVPGYGTGFAGDTGGGVRGRWIDLGYDEDEYRSWSGYVDVYYLAPAPPPNRINYLLPSNLP
jgi:resuscitation-promoting factor RpfB